MKTRFTKEEFEKFESLMINKGFKKSSGQIHSEDYYLYKSLHKIETESENERNDLMIFLRVYDFSKYYSFMNSDFMHIQIDIQITRSVDENIMLTVDEKLCENVDELEKFANNFYKFITENGKN